MMPVGTTSHQGTLEAPGASWCHMVHSDELFVIRQHKRNGQPDEGVCNTRHAVHSDELFALRQRISHMYY